MLSCIILAAGKNTRLDTGKPKSLVEVNGMSLLERHIHNFKLLGVKDFCIVTGHNPDPIRKLAPELAHSYKVTISLVHNENYNLENGYSLSTAESYINARAAKSFFLTMGDHLFQPEFLSGFALSVLNKPHREYLFLAVDKPGDWNRHIDLEDVTKVLACERSLIKKIGKNIADFNYFDTGLFYLKSEVFTVLNSCFSRNKYSISEMVSDLIDDQQAKIIELIGFYWNDVDNPTDLQNTVNFVQRNQL